jgi:hypothetical protein
VLGSLSVTGGATATNGTIKLINNGGGVTNGVAITNVGNLTITSGSTGSLLLGAQVGNTGTSTITLNAGGTGNLGYTADRQLIIANSVSLAAGGMIGTSSASILTNAQNVNINNAGGLVTITDVSNGETVTGGPGTIGGTLGFLGTGTMTFGNLTAAGTLSIVNSNTLGVSNGNIAVNGNLIATGAGSTVNLISNGSGNISGSGSAQATNVNLTTGSGTIGTNFSTPLNVAATNVAPTTTGLVNVTDSQSMTLTGSGINAASSVKLSTANNGNIIVNGQIGNNATGAVTLSANGTGNITATADIHGGPLTLISGTGAIGSNSAALPVVSTNFSATTGGLVNVIDTQTSTAVTVGTSQAGTSFVLSFAGPGPLNLPSLTAVNGPVFVAESGNVTIGTMSAGTNATVFTQSFSGAPVGNITVNGPVTAGTAGAGFVNFVVGTNLTPPGPASLLLTSVGSSITATNGSITLENSNTSNGSIVIGNNSTISTLGATGGAVNIVIGAVPTNPIQGTTPTHTSIAHPGSGTAYFGANSISVPTGPANLKLDGANIVFNTGTLPAGNIILGSNVSITADPTAAPLAALIAPSSGLFEAAAPNAMSSPLLQSQPQLSVRSISSADQRPAGESAAIRSGLAGGLTALNAIVSNLSGTLSAKAGLIGAVNGANIQSLLEGSASNNNAALAVPISSLNAIDSVGSGSLTGSTSAAISGNLINSATATNSSYLADSLYAANALMPTSMATHSPALDGTWMSDTELVTGRIPAVLAADEECGINSPVSTIVEMQEEDAAPQVVQTTRSGKPLVGSVSRTVSGAKVVTLKNGSVVFAPSRDTVVNTPFGTVKIAAKSLVLVMAFQHGLGVFDMHDVHSRAVVVSAGDKELTLSPGMQAVITHDSVRSFEQINPAQLFGYSGLRDRNLGYGLKAFISEFSVTQAISAVTPLKQLVNSEHPQAQKHAKHLLKTAAILNQMHSGTYEQIARTQLTAYQSQSASGESMFGK